MLPNAFKPVLGLSLANIVFLYKIIPSGSFVLYMIPKCNNWRQAFIVLLIGRREPEARQRLNWQAKQQKSPEWIETGVADIAMSSHANQKWKSTLLLLAIHNAIYSIASRTEDETEKNQGKYYYFMYLDGMN